MLGDVCKFGRVQICFGKIDPKRVYVCHNSAISCKDKSIQFIYPGVRRRFPGDSDGKESACNAGDPGIEPGSERPSEEGNATHASILAWSVTWTEEPCGLQSTWSWS